MKKIVILMRAFECGGTETALLTMLKYLDYSKYQVKIYCLLKQGPLLEKIPKHIEVEEISFKHRSFNYSADVQYHKLTSATIGISKIEKRFFKLYAKKNPYYFDINLNFLKKGSIKCDILLDFFGYGSFLTAYGAKKIVAKKKATWIHDERMTWLSRTSKYLEWYDKVFCVSKAVKDKFDQTYPEYSDKSEVFYNLLDVEMIRQKSYENNLKIKKEKIWLVTVGRLAIQKGYDIATKTAAILKNRGYDFEWLALGDGAERELVEKWIRENKVRDCFKLLGRVENPYPYIKNADLYIQTSHNEGYGLAIAEAKILGKVVISTDLNCVREQINNGENGFLVEKDPYKLAEAIQKCLDDRKIIDRIEENLANENFDYIEQLSHIYDLI